MLFALWKEPFGGYEFWIHWDKVWEDLELDPTIRQKHESRAMEQGGRGSIKTPTGPKEKSEGISETRTSRGSGEETRY